MNIIKFIQNLFPSDLRRQLEKGAQSVNNNDKPSVLTIPSRVGGGPSGSAETTLLIEFNMHTESMKTYTG
jgi:hypothetical protein